MLKSKSYQAKQLVFFAGLLFICIIYTLFNISFGDDFEHYLQVQKEFRHVIRFGSILLVYGIGLFVMKRYIGGRSVQIWHFVYWSIVTLLVLVGLYDWGIRRVPFRIRNIADALHLFLISPIPYVAVRILNRYLVK